MKLIFLDRDGVINKDPAGWTEHSYVAYKRDFHFLPGSLDAIKRLTNAGYEIVIISNQAGISKGIYTVEKLNGITELMLDKIKEGGGRVRSVHYCPHRDQDNCACRKPKTGLFEKATEGVRVDFTKTYFIGDGVMDVEAGKRIGCKTIFVLSGKTSPEAVKGWEIKPDFIKKDLAEAVNFILSKEVK